MNIDPITIILFLIFFVAPIVNNFLRRGQGGQQGQQGRGRPQQSRPSQRQEGRSDERETTADTSPNSSGSMGDEFRGRLDEARRRVQEAMSEGGSQGGRGRRARGQAQSEAGDSSSDLFPRLDEERQARSQQGRSQQGRTSQGRSQQGQTRGQTRQPFEGLGREGVSRQRPASQQGTMTKQSSVDRTELGAAPPLRVQRLKPRKSSKINEPKGVLEFDRRSVMQGIIWREILDEPLSKRKRRKRH